MELRIVNVDRHTGKQSFTPAFGDIRGPDDSWRKWRTRSISHHKISFEFIDCLVNQLKTHCGDSAVIERMGSSHSKAEYCSGNLMRMILIIKRDVHINDRWLQYYGRTAWWSEGETPKRSESVNRHGFMRSPPYSARWTDDKTTILIQGYKKWAQRLRHDNKKQSTMELIKKQYDLRCEDNVKTNIDTKQIQGRIDYLVNTYKKLRTIMGRQLFCYRSWKVKVIWMRYWQIIHSHLILWDASEAQIFGTGLPLFLLNWRPSGVAPDRAIDTIHSKLERFPQLPYSEER